MKPHITETGKFFTHIITKDPIPAAIQTLSHRIEGTVHVRRGDRLLDELTSAEQFLAVTGATVYTKGEVVYRAEFLTINRDHIVWLMPTEDTGETRADAGGEA
jgi:hypothetical protein